MLHQAIRAVYNALKINQENGASVSEASKIAKLLFKVKKSPVGGRGAFAAKPIRKGTRVIEYEGDRKKWSSYDDDESDNYVFLFDVGKDTVIDPFSNGNEARFINHSCAPNCEAVTEDGRIYIEAVRDIKPGEELFYDYGIKLGRRPTKADRERYACNCNSRKCRGTMLCLPESMLARKKRAKTKSRAKKQSSRC